MICDDCAKAGDTNRAIRSSNMMTPWGLPVEVSHPRNCGCTCQHRSPQEWGKFFSVEPPSEERS